MSTGIVRPGLVVLTTLFVSVGFATTADAAKPIKNPPPAPAQYVALGDSYAAGGGAGSYIDSTCHRSLAGYPGLIADYGGLGLDLQACSGATTSDVLGSQLSTLDAGTAYVTVTIGGNDVGFSDVITTCAGTDTSACLSAVDTAVEQMTTVLPGRLDTVFGAVKGRATGATIVATGYPRLFNGVSDCSVWTTFTSGEMAALNNGASTLAGVIGAAAERSGIGFTDVQGPFDGHAICDGTPWINNFVLFGDSFEFYHPNAAGYQYGYAPSVTTALDVSAPAPSKPGKGRSKTVVTLGGVTSSDTERGTVDVATN